MKILAPSKEADDEPRGKNKRVAIAAAKGGDKGGKAKPAKADAAAAKPEGEA